MSTEDWQIATLESAGDGTGERLSFRSPGGLAQALSDGFFFVAAPEPAIDLSAGDRFAQSFYLPATGDDPFRGYEAWTPDRLGEHEGYYRRDVDQTEQFFLEHRLWDKVYPAPLVRQAQAMRDFALAILRGVLRHLDLPPELWDQATGHALSGQGTYHLTFNHFRSDLRLRGLNVHKDSGWVTVLRSIEPGLEVQKGGRWLPITPIPGHFIINFGCAMEILTRWTRTPVAAVAHRVTEVAARPSGTPDRFSYALFVDSSLDESVCPGLFRYERDFGLALEMSFKTFLAQILENTYRESSVGLYER